MPKPEYPSSSQTVDNTTNTRIPYKNLTEFDDSPLYYDSSVPKVVSDVLLEVPGGTIAIGETTDLSSGSGELIISDQVKAENKYIVTSEFDSTGASQPNYFDLGAQSVLNVQTDFSQVITTNPLTWSLTGTVVSPEVRQINSSTFKTGGVMTNVRATFTDNATGIVVRYIPDKASWDAGTGLTLISGDNKFDFISTAADTPGVFNLGVNPFELENGQQLDIDMRADSVNVLGDVGGQPYQLADIQDGLYTDIGLDSHAKQVQTTGLLEGGVISIASGTTVDWTSGHGQVVNYADPENTTITDVFWDAVTGTTPTNLATDGTTLFGYNAAGSVVEKLSTAMSIIDAHTTIWFGSATHISSTIVSVVTAPGNLGYNGIGSFSDFVNLIIGPSNVDGNVYGANGANMTIDVVGGNAFMLGSNFRTDKTIPDTVTLANDTALTFNKVYRSAGAGLSIEYDGAPTTLIDPTSYDDGSGTLQTTTAGYWTIQRIFRSRTGGSFVAYGQEEFASKALALEALGNESFTEKSPLPFTLFRCSLVVSQAATTLNNTAQAEFFDQSSFRIFGAQSASSTIPGVTSPGGSTGSIQFNNSSAFGGDANFLYDSTLKTIVLEAPGSGSATFEFANSSDVVKGVIKYAETADEFSISATGTTSEIHLNDTAYVHRGTIDGRIDIHSITNAGCALLTLSNFAGGTGLSLEHDDATDESIIDSEIGSLTLQTTTASTDIILNPTRRVGVKKADPDSVLHIYQSDNETGIQTGLTIEQDGTGDAVTQYLLTGGQRWVTGIDNSGSDAYKISSSLDLASNAQLVLETDGRSEFLGKLGVNILPASTMHVYEDTAEVSAAAGLTIEQDGVGDAVAQFLITGEERWVMGIDNSDDDNFVFAKSADLNSNQQLVLQVDGKSNFYGTLGVGKIPDDGYRLDVLTAISTVVGLSSFKAVTIESGKNGSGNSTDLFFNRGNVGFNQSEFTMFNDNNASGPARMFRMGYSDDIDTSGGLTIWKTRNNVAVGTYSLPDSVFTVSENTTEIGDQCGITIIQQSSGDALLQYLLDGGQRWVTGIDNSANNAYKIASSINLGSNDMFVLEPDAGAFLYSHTDDVLTLGNSTGETSKISVDNAGDPEGAVTGTGGDIHVNSNGVSSRMALKKSSASSTADWYDVALTPPVEKVIYNTAELEAMATAGVITVSSSTTWKIKGHLDSATRIVLANRAQLHIVTDNSNQSSWTYSGTGTFLSGTGGFRSLEFFDILSSSTGTFTSLDLDGRSMNLTLCGLFLWDDLGSLSNGTFILDVSDIFENDLGFDFTNMKITITQSNISDNEIGSTPMFDVDNSFIGAKSISVNQLSGSFNAGSSLFRIEPALDSTGKVDISGCIFTGGQLFDTSGATGEFSAVADASVSTETITSVSDSSGVARFNFSAPPTLFVNQEVVISGYGTRTSFNGTHIITATGAGYFEVAGIDYEAGVDSGSFISNSVTMTDTGTTLSDGDQIVINTLNSTDYDNGAVVYNQLTNTFQVNRAWVATETGTWSQAGLNQSDPRVIAHDNPDYTDSKYLAFGHIEENPIANTTVIASADTYQAANLTGTTGFVTVFATNGAGGTTCTSATHGLVENQNVVLTGGDEYYKGTYTVFNVLTNTFDIAITFQSTVLTSTWISGVISDSERFKVIDPTVCKFEYIGNEPFEGSIKTTWSVNKTATSEDYIFSSGKNGVSPEQGAPFQKRTVTTSTSVHPVTIPVNLIAGDTIQPILAGVGTTSNITVENLQMEVS